MYKRIDENDSGQPERLKGFTYACKNGFIEGVHMDFDTVDIGNQDLITGRILDDFTVYTDDIPLLVEALQSAYNFITTGAK